MPHATKVLIWLALCATGFCASVHAGDELTAKAAQAACSRPVYLTFDTGHMQVAQSIADILNKHQVKVTFFAANEKTKDGSTSLSDGWGEKFWSARGKEGHEFASHTWDHPVWRGDVDGAEPRFVMQPTQGPQTGQRLIWGANTYCTQLDQAREKVEQFTGKKALPLFRAPGGKTSLKLLTVAQSCGYQHVGWADAGFLGDELPSDRFSNAHLLSKALRDIRAGDVLMAHLGIWSRKDPWAPAVLEPLIVGLKQKGFCFQTLRHHPSYQTWIAAKGR